MHTFRIETLRIEYFNKNNFGWKDYQEHKLLNELAECLEDNKNAKSNKFV